MSAPSPSAAGGSPIFAVSNCGANLHSSPLRLDPTSTRGSTGTGSPWMHPADPGSPLDDSRSFASSTRSSRRRRGGPETVTVAGEGREWLQVFGDLEKMQRENKERMQSSVRSGRSSPGDDPFVQSGSISSCRSSVRRRRWGAPSPQKAPDASAAPAGCVSKEPERRADAPASASAAPSMEKVDRSTAAAAYTTAPPAPRLLAAAGTTDAPHTSGREEAAAECAASPLSAADFSSVESDRADVQSGLKPRLSGLPIWLKRRPTANTPKVNEAVATSTPESPRAPESAGVAPVIREGEEVMVQAVPSSTQEPLKQLPSAEQEKVPAIITTTTRVAAHGSSAEFAGAPSGEAFTSPVRNSRGAAAASSEHQVESMKRSPVPSPRKEGRGAAAHATRPHTTAGAAATSHGRQGAPAASPLMQNCLARHTRAAALAAPDPAESGGAHHADPTPVVAAPSSSSAEVTAVLSPVVVCMDMRPEEDPATAPTISVNAPLTTPMSEKKKLAEAPEVLHLTAAIVVDSDHNRQSETTIGTGEKNTPQAFSATFTHAKETEHAHHDHHYDKSDNHDNRRSSDGASAAESIEKRPKRTARVVRQDFSAKKLTIDHTAAPAEATQQLSPPRERHSPSISRARPSADDYPTVSVARESCESSYARSEVSVTRTSRPRRSSVVQPAASATTQAGTQQRQQSLPPDMAESSVARYARERSGATDLHARYSRPASGRPSDGPSGSLHRSTALFDLRRQQVLQERQERERKAAAEERARVGPAAHNTRSMHGTERKKALTSTTGGGAAVAPAMEKTFLTASAVPSSSAVAPAAPAHGTADLEGSMTVMAIRRPVSVSATTSAATNARPRPAANGVPNASTTTVVVSPTVTQSAQGMASGAAEATPSNGQTAGEGSATHATKTPVKVTPALLHARKPFIHTTTLNAALGAHSPASTSTAAILASSPSAARGRDEARTGGAPAGEGITLASRNGKPTLNTLTTRAQLQRNVVSTRRDLSAPLGAPTAAASPPTASSVATATATGLRRAERRVSANVTALTTVKQRNLGATVRDGAGQTTAVAAGEGSTAAVPSLSVAQPTRSAPPTPAAQTPATAAVAAEPTAAAAATPSPVPTPASAEPRPAPFCVECGQRHIDDAAKFCAVCGHKRIFL